MVDVHGITKRYGSQLAADEVSFTVRSGEVAGFIGPNGAGKSTTMKIITGTLPPDSGSVHIRKMQVQENNREIRRIIGYLPEHNPLYLDMYIREYLQYVAGLYGIRGREARGRIAQVVEMTGLLPEIHKTIRKLSKGYRQRVGLAQALIHDPEILILDEPTSGLDPNQMKEFRQLIASIRAKKTILLSTHNLREVEAICDRVIIISQGRIVADESAADLKSRSEVKTRTIHIELDGPAEMKTWQALPSVANVRSVGPSQFLLETESSEDIRAEVFKFAVEQGLTILYEWSWF
jgi:ABC-2 type transport system ATP-binding protein